MYICLFATLPEPESMGWHWQDHFLTPIIKNCLWYLLCARRGGEVLGTKLVLPH